MTFNQIMMLIGTVLALATFAVNFTFKSEGTSESKASMPCKLSRHANLPAYLAPITRNNNSQHNPVAVVIPDQHGRLDAKLGRKLLDRQAGFIADALF